MVKISVEECKQYIDMYLVPTIFLTLRKTHQSYRSPIRFH